MNNRGLAKILANLINRAAANHNAQQAEQLKRGLVVKVTIDGRHKRFLMLARLDTYPSPLEWKTVLDYWPENLPAHRPEPTQGMVATSQRVEYALTAAWHKPGLTHPAPPSRQQVLL